MKKKIIIAVITIVCIIALICVLAFAGKTDSSQTAEESGSEAGSETETEIEAETETESETETETTTADPETLIDFDAEYPYIIYVNISLNRVVVYAIDYDGNYSIPYLGFVCSTGLEEGTTPTGTYTISDQYEWRALDGGVYGQYASRICGSVLFHSVPYTAMSKDTLETEEYNKLGEAASLGCVRLTVADAKWIYDNCSPGTTVVMYEDDDEVFEVEFEEPMTIPLDSEYAGWDPTDPDENNPWNS